MINADSNSAFKTVTKPMETPTWLLLTAYRTLAIPYLVSNRTIPDLYDVPFSYNTCVTDRQTDRSRTQPCTIGVNVSMVSQKKTNIYMQTRVVKQSLDLRTSNFKFEFVGLFVFQPLDIRIQASLIRRRWFCLESGALLLQLHPWRVLYTDANYQSDKSWWPRHRADINRWQ